MFFKYETKDVSHSFCSGLPKNMSTYQLFHLITNQTAPVIKPECKSNLKRNCLLRFDTSIISMSTTWMRRNPDRAWKKTPLYNYSCKPVKPGCLKCDASPHTRFLRSSHPSPPAPMTKILHVSNKNCKDWYERNIETIKKTIVKTIK